MDLTVVVRLPIFRDSCGVRQPAVSRVIVRVMDPVGAIRFEAKKSRMEAGGIMNFGRKTRAAFVAMACCGLMIQSTPSFAAPPRSNDTAATAKVSDSKPSESKPAAQKPGQPAAIDVALEKDGVVSGRILDTKQENGVANTPVVVRQGKEEIASTTTDSEGRFQIKNLKGGLYVVSANKGHGLFRMWAPKSAPPVAHDKVLLMSDAIVVRAQNDGGEVLYDDNGQPYARVHVIDNGAIATENCPPVGSGGLCGLDVFTVTLLGAAIAAAVLAGIALDKADDDAPASP